MSTTAGGGEERAGARSGLVDGLLTVLFVISVVAALGNFVWLYYAAGQKAKADTLVTHAQISMQQLPRLADAAAVGRVDAFDSLRQANNAVADILNRLKQGDPQSNMQGYADEPSLRSDFANVDAAWKRLDADVGEVFGHKDQVLSLVVAADQFERGTAALNVRMDDVVKILVDRGASGAQVGATSRQMLSVDRMQRRVQAIVRGGEDSPQAVEGLQHDVQFYGAALGGLLNGDADLGIKAVDNADARKVLGDIGTQWADLTPAIAKLQEVAPALRQVKQTANKVSADAQALLDKSGPLAAHIADLDSGLAFPSVWAGMGAALLAVVLLVFLVWKLLRDQRRRLARSTELNFRNEAAIQRLLDEMGSLADGDLTVTASVTEDFTGTIADAVNYAVEALRSLVTTINETSVSVASAANETRATALHLADAAEQQSRQIIAASDAVGEVAASANEVSKNSTQGAEVAENSMQIASKGAQIVRQTVVGMDSIRHQIQETSKRIKHLSESSQEIGAIIELINDLSEQTNILALNAAIQAASAGEAGRGFAVVADEVQRLAERSVGATRRIETLVQAIQTDTSEAVTSMEQTTTEVVYGARLAEDAGAQLGAIEKVSNDLAGLIKSISVSAQRQSNATTNVSATMAIIREIASDTSAGAGKTAESIGNLAQLSADLRRSVADFKLPE